jgi:hypothetical protein
MFLSPQNQNLRRDLQGLASDLKWSAVELVRIAERLSAAGNDPDAQALQRMIAMFQREEGRVSLLMDEVSAGQIVRSEREARLR